jgi:hypothetical protein
MKEGCRDYIGLHTHRVTLQRVLRLRGPPPVSANAPAARQGSPDWSMAWDMPFWPTSSDEQLIDVQEKPNTAVWL